MGTSTSKHRITNKTITGNPSRRMTQYLNNFKLGSSDTATSILMRDGDAQQVKKTKKTKNPLNHFIQNVAEAGVASFGAWAIENDSYIANRVVYKLLNFTQVEWKNLENPDARRQFCHNFIQEVFSDLPHAEDQDMLKHSLDQALDEMVTDYSDTSISAETIIHLLVEASLQARLNLIIENHIEDKIIMTEDLKTHEFISSLRRCIKDVSQECRITVSPNITDFTNIVSQLWKEIIDIIQEGE